MPKNGSDHQEAHASSPDYKHLAEKAIGQQLYKEFEAVEEAHQALWGALVFQDNPRHIGPTDFDHEQLEDALDAVAAYEWFLCNRVAPLLVDGSLEERFYKDEPRQNPTHISDD